MTEEQIDNLRKLADYLDTIPSRNFSMDDYARYKNSVFGAYEPEIHFCGTVCCALGNGPRAGFPALDKEFWDSYALRVFGLRLGSRWDWCFSWQWTATDNTPAGAAARIRWLLNRGLPRNWQNQMHGKARRLCYAKELVS